MYARLFACLLVTMWVVAVPLFGQQPCPSFSVAVGSDEDHLMLGINGADNPQEQIAALDKYAQANANSKFMACANEYYASIYLKQNNFDKSIEYAEKDLAANYQDLNLLLTLMRAYVGSTKVSDTIFDIINKVPDQVQTEVKPSRPDKATDAEWDKIQKDAAELAKDSRAYAVYAFFQLEPRLTDPAKRIQVLDNFTKSYPEAEKDYAGQLNNAYFDSYRVQGQLDKALEYGEKTIAADPNNLVVLNTLGFIYAFGSASPQLDKAAEDAQKAITVAQDMKKPEGVDDATFKQQQTNQLGMAHLTLGYAAFVKAQKTKKLSPAIDELKTAVTLLDANPALQGQALYYLAYAYESGYPANHRGAIDALTKAQALSGPFQNQAHDLLVKVKAAAAKQ
jgi:tetratricopeptide (TPR) repeat protein